MKKPFNIIICGVGGQGLITLLQIISEAALLKGFDVKTSELHGLSQRGGSVSVHVRFGREVFSPMVLKADLIIALESQEALNFVNFSDENTFFLINKFQTPTLGESISEKAVKNNLEKLGRKYMFVPSTDIVQKELKKPVLAGVHLLGVALFKKLLPLKEEDIILSLEKFMPKQFLDVNIKALQLAKKNA